MSLALMSHKEPQRTFAAGMTPVTTTPIPATCDPKPACPLVFHMFGHVGDPRSLVLTEDDYLDFLVRTSVNPDLPSSGPKCDAEQFPALLRLRDQRHGFPRRPPQPLPDLAQRHPAGNPAIRSSSSTSAMTRSVPNRSAGSRNISIGTAPQAMSIGVYWGSTNEFMIELRQRWEDFRVNSPLVEPARPPVSPAVSATDDSPYVGPRPFLSTDFRQFFGRDREAVDLKHRVMAHPITLLYSMSGAGKTSLINARLVPDLEGEDSLVLPPARLRGLSWNVDPAEIPNIYVFHAVMSWQSQCDAHTAGRLKSRTLKEEMAPKAKLAEDNDSLLIAVFDQFEELFTAYSSRWSDRREFFEQLSDALESIRIFAS